MQRNRNHYQYLHCAVFSVTKLILSSSAAYGCFSMQRHRLYSVIHPTPKCSRKSYKTTNEAANTHTHALYSLPVAHVSSECWTHPCWRRRAHTLSLCVCVSHCYLAILHRAASSSAPAIQQAHSI